MYLTDSNKFNSINKQLIEFSTLVLNKVDLKKVISRITELEYADGKSIRVDFPELGYQEQVARMEFAKSGIGWRFDAPYSVALHTTGYKLLSRINIRRRS
ncbi:MAG: hypothetical protein HOP02_09905 [Methylococcaceae bacterium]|nr:hypothetical protein [Methylococcaceae bacterium]